MSKLKEGIIQIYAGNGKGKTTAAFGLTIRALGRGLQVCFIQFLKGDEICDGASIFLRNAKNFRFASYGTGKFIVTEPTEVDRQEAKKAFIHAKEAILNNKYDLVILDELTLAAKLSLVKLEDILSLLESRPKNIEVVITGRDPDPKLIEKADLVTEMKKIKHPFDDRIQAREGIEF